MTENFGPNDSLPLFLVFTTGVERRWTTKKEIGKGAHWPGGSSLSACLCRRRLPFWPMNLSHSPVIVGEGEKRRDHWPWRPFLSVAVGLFSTSLFLKSESRLPSCDECNLSPAGSCRGYTCVCRRRSLSRDQSIAGCGKTLWPKNNFLAKESSSHTLIFFNPLKGKISVTKRQGRVNWRLSVVHFFLSAWSASSCILWAGWISSFISFYNR